MGGGLLLLLDGAYSCLTCFGALLAGTLSKLSTLLANIILVGRTVVRRNDSRKPLNWYFRLFSLIPKVVNRNGRMVVVREFLPILPPAVEFLGTLGVLREPGPPSVKGGDETLWNFCCCCCCWCFRLVFAALDEAPPTEDGFCMTIIGYLLALADELGTRRTETGSFFSMGSVVP